MEIDSMAKHFTAPLIDIEQSHILKKLIHSLCWLVEIKSILQPTSSWKKTMINLVITLHVHTYTWVYIVEVYGTYVVTLGYNLTLVTHATVSYMVVHCTSPLIDKELSSHTNWSRKLIRSLYWLVEIRANRFYDPIFNTKKKDQPRNQASCPSGHLGISFWSLWYRYTVKLAHNLLNYIF